MSDGRGRHLQDAAARASIGLLDQAVVAINGGDRVAGTTLAGQVLAVDQGNADAEDPGASQGCTAVNPAEIHRARR